MEGFLEEITKSIMQQQQSDKKTQQSLKSKQSSGGNHSCVNLGDILSTIAQGYVQGCTESAPNMSDIVQQFKESPFADIVQALEKEFSSEETDPPKKGKDDGPVGLFPRKKERTPERSKPTPNQVQFTGDESLLVQGIPSDIRTTFPIDIREMETSCIVYAEIPGADKSTIIVEVEGDTLVVVATKVSYPLGSDEFHCIERSKGVYVRSIKLPSIVDTNNVSMVVAKYCDGVLSVKMPKIQKQSESKSRRVIVQ